MCINARISVERDPHMLVECGSPYSRNISYQLLYQIGSHRTAEHSSVDNIEAREGIVQIRAKSGYNPETSGK